MSAGCRANVSFGSHPGADDPSALSRTASFTREGLTALIQIDGKKIVLSNGETIELESKALIINGRIYLLLVNVGQVFGLTSGNSLDGEDQDIEWDDMDKTVTINIK